MVKTFCTLLHALFVRVNFRRLIIVSLLASTTSVLHAANIVLSPQTGEYSVGKNFSIDVLVTNNKESINAVSASLGFSADVIELLSISKSGSIITMWAEDPTFSNGTGKASFEGVILNPGFSDAKGKVVSLNFRAKKTGTASLVLSSGSVLANDGNATNVVGALGNATLTIVEAVKPTETVSSQASSAGTSGAGLQAPTLRSPTHPDQSSWYAARDVTFEWSVPSLVTAVRTLYNEKEISTPNKVYDPPIDNRSFTTDTDGIMFMHVQFKSSNGWGPTAHYRFQIDTQEPTTPRITFPDGATTTNPTPAILVESEDTTSGLDYLMISVGDSEPTRYLPVSSHIYHLPKQAPGKHTALITVYDKAGNSRSASIDYTILAIAVPKITEYTKNIQLGNSLVVTGTTYPQTSVEVALTDRKGALTTESVTSDGDGNFRLLWTGTLGTGVYEMRARAIDAKGATSEYSDGKAIVVEYIALVRFGIFIMNWLSLILVFVVAGVAVAATFWYSFIQFSRFRRKVRRTMLEAENTLKTNVQALRRDTEEFHTILVKAEKKRALTKEEQSILKKFKKRLEITENEIEKKLEAIG